MNMVTFSGLKLIKITLADELKTLDDKIKVNQARYDLDRKAAKISALLSKQLCKYECLTGEYLEYKPEVVERAKFESSPWGMTLSKGLKKDYKMKKAVKYDDDLMYNFVHNFNKYSVSNFNETSSLNSKFDTLNKFHNDFKKVKDVKSKTNETKQKKWLF